MLRVLKRHGAQATFFALGSQLDAYPAVARRVVREGHVLANHTYGHVDLTRVGDRRFADELERTQAAIRRAGGGERIVRPPFGAWNARARALAARLGYRTVLWDVDPQDWRRPGASSIAATLLAQARPGSILLLHDGGGDRAQTVAALDRALAVLRARGYRFAPLRAAATLEAPPPESPPGEDALPLPEPTGPDALALARPELIASFTSRYPAGEPRVVNIRRAAELLDRTVIPPGGRFSMNAALGKRTLARGFVAAPMISGGRLVQSVGGGISQVATALYNAAFFGGLTLVEHTPHSFYISRYPMGREATISWGGPELVFDNRWRSPVVVRVRASSDRITVRLWSRREGRKVESWTGRPYAHVRPTTRYVSTASLPRGVRRVVQEAGGSGFTIAYGRRVLRGTKTVATNRFTVRYEPVNRIVEVGTR